MKKILLSVKPKFAEKILSGEKIVEYRKRIPKNCMIKRVLIYASSPIKRVVAEFTIGEILKASPDNLWEKTRHTGGISREEFQMYFRGKDIAYAYIIKNLHVFEKSQSLVQYRLKKAPQDFCYVEEN